VELVAEAIPKSTYLHDPHVTKEAPAPTEDTAAAVIHVVGIVETGTAETGTAETEITIEETGTAIEEIEVSIVDEATEADIMTVAATEEASVVAEEVGDSEVVIEEDGTGVLDIVVVGLRAMLPPVGLQEISLSTHRPVLLAEEEVDTKTNTVVARIMSLSVVAVVWARLLDLSLHPQDKNILNNEVDTTIDDDTRTEVEAPNEITIEVMAGNGVIAMEMIDGVVIVESTRMKGAGVKKMIAVQNDGGIKIAKVLGKSGE
jgi:hypothetical protein